MAQNFINVRVKRDNKQNKTKIPTVSSSVQYYWRGKNHFISSSNSKTKEKLRDRKKQSSKLPSLLQAESILDTKLYASYFKSPLQLRFAASPQSNSWKILTVEKTLTLRVTEESKQLPR